MRALVLGGSGAVGRVVVATLRERGHEATVASRSSPVRVDLGDAGGWAALARHADAHDVVINASGVEDARLASSVGDAALVDISATGRYLAELRDAAAHAGTRVLLGAGIAPGLSTVLAAALIDGGGGFAGVSADVGDGPDIDIAVRLGTGERHGPQAVAWTAGLAGRDLHLPPEGAAVRNFVERRVLVHNAGRRGFLRADFPDHVLLAPSRRARVRTYLAVGDRVTTAALGLVGRAPRLAPLLAAAPHWGDARWSVTATDRRSGRTLTATGEGQSRATGILAARSAEALHASSLTGAVTTADVATIEQVREWLDVDAPAGAVSLRPRP